MQSTIRMPGARPRELAGDWRRRRGTKTDAHLYGPSILPRNEPSGRRPLCGKNVRHVDTERVDVGRPCTDCLVAGIRAAGRPVAPESTIED
jgi:hypothetical protein